MNQSEIHRYLAEREGLPADHSAARELFNLRLSANFTLIQTHFFRLYPEAQHRQTFERLIGLLPQLYARRPEVLRTQDQERLYHSRGHWYQDHGLVGMQLYVDRFTNNLKGLTDRLDYFERLGVNFLHLMPVTPRPPGENDGGYAVSDYTGVDPSYGSQQDLLELAGKMREKGMILMMDFVVNHTADNYPWARKAKQGDTQYQQYYYTFPDRSVPDAFEKTLPEVFPETAPGNFTYIEEMDRWVMTVFNRYQWDLNYSNPEVFLEMLGNLSDMVNQGVDVVRFDALAFLWKRIGTTSQNLPEAHILISLFRMCLQVIAPGVVLLAEAIVTPEEIVRYFGEEERRGNECEIAYNASLMALLWNSVATAETNLLYRSLEAVPQKPRQATWVNYIRCHDDIGLGYDDALIREQGWDPKSHRRFLLDYYTGGLDWSPARGVPFMFNPRTGDGRISGSAASLLGLEAALENGDREAQEQALDKLLMLHGIILSFGGIPMLYAGDELAALNDYSYLENENEREDSRWVHRPFHPWKDFDPDGDQYPMQLYRSLQKLIAIRQSDPVFSDLDNTRVHRLGNPHVFAFERFGAEGKNLLVLANFGREEQVLDSAALERMGYVSGMRYHDLVTGQSQDLSSALFPLKPYALLWLRQF